MLKRALPDVLLVAAAAWLGLLGIHHFKSDPAVLSPAWRSVLYGVPTATLSAGILWTIFLGRKYRTDVALLATASILCLLLLSLAVDLIPRPTAQEVHFRQLKSAGRPVDVRSKREVVLALRASGERAFPSFHPRDVLFRLRDLGTPEVLPLAGISKALTVWCNENGRYAIYRGDRHGFDNPDSLWDAPRWDLALIGDSMTQGGCVSSEESIGAVLRRRFPVTLNLGFGGHGPLLQLATLVEYVGIGRPKYVLWFYFEGNDLSDLLRESMAPAAMRYLEVGYSQRLAGRQAEIDSRITAYTERKLAETAEETPGAFTHSRFHTRTGIATLKGSAYATLVKDVVYLEGLKDMTADLFPLYRQRQAEHFIFHESRHYRPVLELYSTILRRAKETAAQRGSVLIFVYLPDWQRRSGVPYSKDNMLLLQHRERMLRLVSALNIPLIDATSRFAPDRNTHLHLFEFPGSHYTASGYREVADEVAQALGFIAPASIPAK